MPERESVNFTPEAAERISEAVQKVEQMPHPGKNLQRRRAGGLGRSELWEVTAVNDIAETCTIKRVENQAGDLIDISQKIDILYDTDQVPQVGARGLLIRLGNGNLMFFEGGGGVAMSPIKITGGGPGENHTGNVYGNGKDQAATETSVTIKVLQIDSGETIPTDTWLPAWKQVWSGTEYWTVDVARDY